MPEAGEMPVMFSWLLIRGGVGQSIELGVTLSRDVDVGTHDSVGERRHFEGQGSGRGRGGVSVTGDSG